MKNILMVGFFLILAGVSACKKDKPTLPVPEITTNPVLGTVSNDVTSGGTIISDGGSAVIQSGVVWSSTTEAPTLQNNQGKSTDGTLSGSYTSSFSNLNPNTTYYVRAYASSKNGTGYGSLVCFVVDIDYNIYRTVKIGSQIWLSENLRTTKLNDNTPILLVELASTWSNSNLTDPMMCYYSNFSGNKNGFGGLYNWYVVNTGKLAPKGWHVATQMEYNSLFGLYGGFASAAIKLKESGIDYWNVPNGTNESGFTALPGGQRNGNDGSFAGIYQSASYMFSSNDVGVYRITETDIQSLTPAAGLLKQFGASIRCVRDTPAK